MNLLSTDYLSKVTSLLREAFKFKKYEAMHPFLAVITGITMIPFVAISLILSAFLIIDCFLFKIAKLPIDFLHNLVNQEGKEVKHATQFIIYFISWPLIFVLYALISFMLLWISIAYAIVSCIIYIWTLGGFKFHLYANEADDISIEVNGRYNALAIVYVCVQAAILLFIPIIHGTVLYADLYYNYMEQYFSSDFAAAYNIYYRLGVAFAFFYSLIGFAPRPKSQAKEDDITE